MEYNKYCNLLEYYCLNERLDENILTGVSDAILGAFKNIKKYVVEIASKLGVSVLNIINALKQKEVFSFLKSFGFNFQKILDYIKQGYNALKGGIDKIFIEIEKTGVIQKLKSGALKVDDFLNKYPMLKKLAGPALVGILIYMWINMSFIGDFSDDFDISNILNAISGNFTISDLFLSPSGLKFLTLFSTGGLLSFPWVFGSFPISIIVALIYTGYKKLKNNPELLKKIQTNFKSLIGENEIRLEIRKVLKKIEL